MHGGSRQDGAPGRLWARHGSPHLPTSCNISLPFGGGLMPARFPVSLANRVHRSESHVLRRCIPLTGVTSLHAYIPPLAVSRASVASSGWSSETTGSLWAGPPPTDRPPPFSSGHPDHNHTSRFVPSPDLLLSGGHFLQGNQTTSFFSACSGSALQDHCVTTSEGA